MVACKCCSRMHKGSADMARQNCLVRHDGDHNEAPARLIEAATGGSGFLSLEAT